MSTDFPDLPPLKDVIREHGLLAKKSLGQNFLMNPSVTDYIAGSAGDLTKGTVVEVGPGPGGLTRSLLRAGANNLVALEKDERCVNALHQLSLAFPYNVATTLLIGWLKLIADKALPIQSMTLMFQREVGQRITASPGSKSYGRLSVLCQWLCDTYSVCELPPSAFTPPPKVHSTVVGFKPLAEPRFNTTLKSLETVTAAAFGQRRKMLRQSLKKLDVELETLLAEAQIAGTRRPEELSIQEFGQLASTYESLAV